MLPQSTLSPFQRQRSALDQRRVRHGTVDAAAQLHVCKSTRGKGEGILLKGITDDTVNAERTRADVVFVLYPRGDESACRASDAIRSGTRYAK